MALQQILQALETETERQIALLQQDGAAQVAAIHVQASADADAVYQQQVAAIGTPLQREEARILNRARLEALQISLQAREEQLHAALAAAMEQLAALRANGTYAALLHHLTGEAVTALATNEPCHIAVLADDVALMESIVAALGIVATVEGALGPTDSNADPQYRQLGGLVITTQDGRIRLDNTLQTRLARVATLYRSEIAALLFGPNQATTSTTLN